MNTYPVSEPEMENIASLSAQVTIRLSLASLLCGLAFSIWINAMFYASWTPIGTLAAKYIAPLLLFFCMLFVIGGLVSFYQRRNAWTKIKTDSVPMQAIAPTSELVVSN